MTETLNIENLVFTVKRSDKRKSIGITVERDGELVLHAPTQCSMELIEEFAYEKLFWVYTKLSRKELLQQSARQREIVSGEGYYYLGRSYRLLMVDAQPSVPPLRLYQGRFHLRRDVISDSDYHFIKWYTRHAKTWLYNRTELYAKQMAVQFSGIQVTDLGYKWGSYSTDRTINFHWRTILLPPDIVDYIVVHELAHEDEPHHTKAFWQRISLILPNYKERKVWLAENGAGYDL